MTRVVKGRTTYFFSGYYYLTFFALFRLPGNVVNRLRRPQINGAQFPAIPLTIIEIQFTYNTLQK